MNRDLIVVPCLFCQVQTMLRVSQALHVDGNVLGIQGQAADRARCLQGALISRLPSFRRVVTP